ncbi:MAG: prolyl oligopeptidase family serine peptidase [Imperialibacter sp.]|uniref:prolyl oligopeptidase family serine peptidase n=1 Tax=Imperialibacter sp. TaxID=2038411 RepID=UPI0032F016B1
MRKLFILIVLAGFVSYCSQPPKEEPVAYPKTDTVAHVDEYFGTKVEDPYRWLENDTSAATAQWVEAENKVTFGYLNNIDFKDAVKERLTKLWDYEKVYAPFKRGDYYYFYKNDGLQNQNVLYRVKNLGDEPEEFLNPNTFSADGTVSLAGLSFSKDGSLAGMLLSDGGSDWRKGVLFNTATKELVGDTLRDLKFTGFSWRGNEGVYYGSYDKPKDGSVLSGKTQHHKLYFHKLGEPQASDKLILGGAEFPRRYVGANLTEDERFLVISASVSTTGNELYIQDLTVPNSPIKPIVDNVDKEHYVIDNDGETLFIFTNLDAPNNRIVKTSFADPTPATWADVIPETKNVLSASTAGKKIFAEYLVDAKSEIKQYNRKGELERDVELPGIGSIYGFGGEESDTDIYYTFTSFTYPSSIFSYNIASGKSSLYQQPKVDFNPEDYTTEQVFYSSKDGTKIPMFITYKKGVEKNGKNPTYLYSYGGFNISMTPGFSVSRIVWLENGGIYAQPSIRGGGEYGEEWHLAGTKMKKQNVFDDFIGAAEYLIKEGYTSSDYLAIAGGSNGGLLVGATMTQRPELFKVALPAVGVMDMLRYHTFTAGAGWAYDYGTSEESEEMFKYILGYSPVHNVKEGVKYPATLVTTADHDDRVVPAHSFKFAAQLQAKQAGDNPVLIRIETRAGHGAGKPTSKIIEEAADLYSFTWYNMGVVPEVAKKAM